MQTRNTLLMAVVLVALSAFVYFYEIRGRAEREEAAEQESLLLHFDSEDVTGLSITTDEGTVSATKSDGTWRITEPIETAADSTAIQTVVDNVSRAGHQRLVIEAADDLEPFGLAEPVAMLVLERTSGEPLRLALGKNTPVGASVYATVGDGNNVYSVMSALRRDVAKTLFDLRDRGVLSFDSGSIDRIELQQDGMDAALRRDGDGWTAETPFAGSADAETIDDLLRALGSAQAEAFVTDTAPDDATLAEYGLDTPRITATLHGSDDARYRLIVGNEATEPDGFYAMVEGGASVFVVAEDLLDEFPADAVALRDKQVLRLSRQRLAEITIERRGNATIKLVRRGTEWSISQPRRLDADVSALSRILSALTDLRAEGFDRAGDASTATIRVGLRAPGSDTDAVEETLEIAVGNQTTVVPLDERGDEDAETIEVFPVTAAGSDTAFLVPVEDIEDLLVDLFTIRAKTLVEFSPDELQTLEVSTADGATHTLSRNGDEWTAEGGELGENDVADMLWDLNYLDMDAVVQEWDGAAPDLSPYGLSPARYRIVASGTNGVIADVRIGDEITTDGEAAARVYAMIDERPAVFEISAALADLLAGLLENLGS